MIEELIFSLSERSRSRICAWMVTSRAVVGSSAMMMRGLQASAMAIYSYRDLGKRKAPESSCGYIP